MLQRHISWIGKNWMHSLWSKTIPKLNPCIQFLPIYSCLCIICIIYNKRKQRNYHIHIFTCIYIRSALYILQKSVRTTCVVSAEHVLTRYGPSEFCACSLDRWTEEVPSKHGPRTYQVRSTHYKCAVRRASGRRKMSKKTHGVSALCAPWQYWARASSVLGVNR